MMTEIYLIGAFCIIGCAYSSYKIGVLTGATRMLEKLQEMDVIDIDDDGIISPKKS